MQSAVEFELGILTQSNAPTVAGIAPELTAGLKLESLVALNSQEDVQAAVNRVAAGAQRLMSLYTPDLEPELYDQTPFLDIAKRFVLARNFAKIRVLVGSDRRIARDSNRFVAMGRRLGSYIEMRYAQHPVPQRCSSYLIADNRSVVLRAAAATWSGIADFSSAENARIILDEFDVAWQANAPDDQLQLAAI